MRNSVLRSVVLVALAVCTLGVGVAAADATFTVDPTALVNGYMNVFDLSYVYQWGSGWAPADLTATWSGSDVTLGPNSINDPATYWYLPAGGPGAVGQKIMEANLYAEVNDGSLSGQNVTFQGFVTSNTFTSAHVAIAFVKDFAPDFSSFNIATVALPTSGAFAVSLPIVNDPGRHVQWGFQVTGVCVWVTDRDAFGSAVVTPALVVPTKSQTWGALKSLYR